jgi:pumilio family protein 6
MFEQFVYIYLSNPAQRSIIIGAFRGHVVSLLRQTWSAEILELAYNDYANAQQRSDIITEFYGREYAVFRVSYNLVI